MTDGGRQGEMGGGADGLAARGADGLDERTAERRGGRGADALDGRGGDNRDKRGGVWVLQRLRGRYRIPIKLAIFGLTVLFVCFPYPARLVRHVMRWRSPNDLIEPNAPALEPLVAALRPQLTAGMEPKEVLKTVEKFVYEEISYDWDWNTWGMADYIPTVTEAIDKGREDCDGRAVVAASLLARFGYDATIVTDFAHVWVKTEHGETMGPGKRKAVVATDGGLSLQRDALAQVPRALAYGVAVFPWERELIILVVAWLLLLRPRGGVLCGGLALVLFVVGLLLLRAGGSSYEHGELSVQLGGMVSLAAGVGCLLIWARRNARRAAG